MVKKKRDSAKKGGEMGPACGVIKNRVWMQNKHVGMVIRLDVVHAKINFDLLAWLERRKA